MGRAIDQGGSRGRPVRGVASGWESLVSRGRRDATVDRRPAFLSESRHLGQVTELGQSIRSGAFGRGKGISRSIQTPPVPRGADNSMTSASWICPLPPTS
jgi:hypothetical protein